MTQKTDDSMNKSGTTDSTSEAFTVVMDHDKEEEEKKGIGTGTPFSSSSSGENSDSLEKADKSDERERESGEGLVSETEGAHNAGTTSSVTESTFTPAPTLGDSIAAVAKLDSSRVSDTGARDRINPTAEIMDALENNKAEPSQQLTKVPVCAVCSEPCICYCKSCKKVCYCSKEHQKKHWKQHRPDCYPVTIQVNSVFGSHLVLTRDVKRGEVILREKPLVYGPFYGPAHVLQAKKEKIENGSETSESVPNFQSVCLTCHKIIWDHGHDDEDDGVASYATSSSCSKCGWPVCCQDCEENPIHADQECKIFAEYHVGPSALCDMNAQYLCVTLIRILFHKKERVAISPTTANASDQSAEHGSNSSTKATTTMPMSNSKWTKFMEVLNRQMPMKDGLNSQLAESKKATARISHLITKSLGSIIHQEFSVTNAEIDQIVRTLRTSSFITDTDGNYINGFCGLPSSMNNNGDLGSYYCNGQRWNTDVDDAKNRGVARFSGKGKFLILYHLASMLTSNCIPNASWIIQENFEFHLRASTPIKTGERITITFVDPLQGTHKRRERLWQEKYLSCSCSRCSDPTESCTFFSAIKCPGKKAEVGKNSDGGSECEGYILPTDPLAVTYTSCEPSRASKSDTGFPHEMRRDEVRDGDGKVNFLPGLASSATPASPADPLREKLCVERGAEWKCNVCLMRQPWGFVWNSLQRMRGNSSAPLNKISAAATEQEDVCFTITPSFSSDGGGGSSSISSSNNTRPGANQQLLEQEEGGNDKTRGKETCKDLLENLELRVDKIDNFVRNVAHANHYDVLKMENELLTEISSLLEKGRVPFEQMEKWALRMVEWCKKGLKVVNVLCPGLSRERGHLLYFLQQGLVISLLFRTSRAMRTINSNSEAIECGNGGGSKDSLSQEELFKKFQEILLARKEIIEIFAISKVNSKEGNMLKAVQHDSIEFRVLKNYFKWHQNVSR